MIIDKNTVLQTASFEPNGWPLDDKRTLERACIRVRNLSSSIQFYSQHFKMRMKTPLDMPDSPRAALWAGPRSEFCLEIMEPTSSEDSFVGPGDRFAFFTLVVDSTADVCASLKDDGLEELIIDPQVQDLDGYRWKLLEMRTADAPPKEPLCTVALRISSLTDALEWWGATMGASVQQEYDATSGETPAYKVALVGWGKELLSPQLELRQTHPPPEQSLTGFVRVVIGTESLTRTAEALVAPGKAAEAVEIGSLENAQDTEPGLRVEDPDGWEVCFVEKPAARMQEV